MKNLLTSWELRRKTNPKLEPWGLLFLSFFAKAVNWPAARPFDTTKPSCQRSNHLELGPAKVVSYAFVHYKAEPLKIKLLWVGTIVNQVVVS